LIDLNLLKNRATNFHNGTLTDIRAESFNILKWVLVDEKLYGKLSLQQKFTATLMFKQLQWYYRTLHKRGFGRTPLYSVAEIRSFVEGLLNYLDKPDSSLSR